MASKRALAAAVLERHGRTYASELGIPIARGTPSPLYRLLVAATLFSARIGAELAVAAARAVSAAGWTTPQKLAGATWAQRVKVLNRAGYARYDESTSRMLGDSAELLLDRWGGDLRRLREEAGQEPDRERELLKELKGIGDVGVDVFFREAQVAWDELVPFADRRALTGASELGLGGDARALARHVDPADFPRLVAGLVRMGLAKDADGVCEAAG